LTIIPAFLPPSLSSTVIGMAIPRLGTLMLTTITSSTFFKICKYSMSKNKATSIYAAYMTRGVPPRYNPFASLTRKTELWSTNFQTLGSISSGRRAQYLLEWAFLVAANLPFRGIKCFEEAWMSTNGTGNGYYKLTWVMTSAAA
jgi:hypothetical protein